MDTVYIDYYAFLKLNSLSNKKNRSKYLPYLYLLILIFAISIANAGCQRGPNGLSATILENSRFDKNKQSEFFFVFLFFESVMDIFFFFFKRLHMDTVYTDYYAFLKLNSLSNKKNRS